MLPLGYLRPWVSAFSTIRFNLQKPQLSRRRNFTTGIFQQRKPGKNLPRSFSKAFFCSHCHPSVEQHSIITYRNRGNCNFLVKFPVTRSTRKLGTSTKSQDPKQAKLESTPSEVTTTSTIRPIFENRPQSAESNGPGDFVKGGIQHDLSIIKETFAFREVPKEVLFFGVAGLVPYILTTGSTMFLAWDVRNIREEGIGYLLNEQTASELLNFLEPVQVGFGAIILSFLGAIHWGLEFAAYGGSSPYRRYSLGILAPALAWPTVFMAYDVALLAQFMGFTGMYFADAKATTLGWAPRWYTTYRFLLTFIVGACIVMTLIGRGQIGDARHITRESEEKISKLREDAGVVTSPKKYRRLMQQEQELIQEKADKAVARTSQELAEKEAEYEQAKAAADRAAQRLTPVK